MQFTEQGASPAADASSGATLLDVTLPDVTSLPGAMANTLGDLVDSIAALDRMEASIAAFRAELVDQARRWSEVTQSAVSPSGAGWDARTIARRELVTELACALRIPERAAENLIEDSRALVTELPETFAALSAGAISWRHARVLIDHAHSVPENARHAFEAKVLPFAQTLTVAKFDRAARRERERVHPESIDHRAAAAVEKRNVELQPTRDGMAWLSAYLPAVTAQGIYNRVTDMALSQQNGTETRTLTQLRADLFAELLLDGSLRNGSLRDGRVSKIRPRVLITVPVMSLLGHSDEPAMLEGYGPIDLETARELTADAPSLTRILTHPETGAVLSVGRDSYAVPADLRIWLRVRDGTCRFPGCSRAARKCDLDHSADWQFGGQTAHNNLAHLCQAHHHVKHMTGWSVRQLTGGVMEWTSPAGKIYTTQPETKLDSEATAAG